MSDLRELQAHHFERLQDIYEHITAHPTDPRRHNSIATSRIARDGTIRTHSVEAWVSAVGPNLEHLQWFCGSARRHSRDILNPPAVNNGVAYISGNLALTHTVSQPVQGLSFEAVGRLVTDPERQKAIIAEWIATKLFKPDEIITYLTPTKADVPTHGIYEGEILEWRVFDGNEDPRMVIFGGEDCDQPPDGSIHEPNRHLHLPWPLLSFEEQ